MMEKRRKVALLVETSNAYGRELLHGVRAWMRENSLWSVFLAEHGRGDAPPSWLGSWRGDGIIARIENRRIERAVRATRLPVVDLSAAMLMKGIPWLETDDKAIGRLAAEHFLERGFRNLAFCGESRFNWSRWREESFSSHIRQKGMSLSVFNPGSTGRAGAGRDWESDQRQLTLWIRSLPKPVGIFACYDIRAMDVMEACRRSGHRVPDEVAVLGVDNDELLCDLADPPLSSVIPDVRRTGYAAAGLLDRLMRGERVKAGCTLFAPLGVATRQSTDVVAVEDPQVSMAVRYIREHACGGMGVEDLLGQVSLSRRVLEYRFRKLLGRSPHEQILRVRMDRAKRLLAETDLTLAEVAERTGFVHVEYLSVVFKREVGIPPGRYRTRHQSSAAESP